MASKQPPKQELASLVSIKDSLRRIEERLNGISQEQEEFRDIQAERWDWLEVCLKLTAEKVSDIHEAQDVLCERLDAAADEQLVNLTSLLAGNAQLIAKVSEFIDAWNSAVRLANKPKKRKR